jgi:hypothetical protein
MSKALKFLNIHVFWFKGYMMASWMPPGATRLYVCLLEEHAAGVGDLRAWSENEEDTLCVRASRNDINWDKQRLELAQQLADKADAK